MQISAQGSLIFTGAVDAAQVVYAGNHTALRDLCILAPQGEKIDPQEMPRKDGKNNRQP